MMVAMEIVRNNDEISNTISTENGGKGDNNDHVHTSHNNNVNTSNDGSNNCKKIERIITMKMVINLRTRTKIMAMKLAAVELALKGTIMVMTNI